MPVLCIDFVCKVSDIELLVFEFSAQIPELNPVYLFKAFEKL